MSRVSTVLLLFVFAAITANAQYAPQATISGTTAIYKTSSQFSAWATGCTLRRGLQQINDASFGYANLGDSSLALGAPDGNVVSLGDSGVAILTFRNPIVNGPGADFAVFENGFANVNNAEEAFLELAFVEVSSDGMNYFRFSATSLTQDTAQLSSIASPSYTNARQLNNLAGKYIGSYGTPFDLQELDGIVGLDINNITHIRLVDAIGSIGSVGSSDASGRKVNDPFPTPFPGSGFDLDAIGILHGRQTTVLPTSIAADVQLYPNPARDEIQLTFPKTGATTMTLHDAAGRNLQQQTSQSGKASFSLLTLAPGCYFITIYFPNGATCTRAFLHH